MCCVRLTLQETASGDLLGQVADLYLEVGKEKPQTVSHTCKGIGKRFSGAGFGGFPTDWHARQSVTILAAQTSMPGKQTFLRYNVFVLKSLRGFHVLIVLLVYAVIQGLLVCSLVGLSQLQALMIILAGSLQKHVFSCKGMPGIFVEFQLRLAVLGVKHKHGYKINED